MLYLGTLQRLQAQPANPGAGLSEVVTEVPELLKSVNLDAFTIQEKGVLLGYLRTS